MNRERLNMMCSISSHTGLLWYLHKPDNYISTAVTFTTVPNFIAILTVTLKYSANRNKSLKMVPNSSIIP